MKRKKVKFRRKGGNDVIFVLNFRVEKWGKECISLNQRGEKGIMLG